VKVRARLARLERLSPPPPPRTLEERQEQRRWKKIADRLMRLLAQAVPLLNEAEQQQIVNALTEWLDERSGPFARWLRNLQEGWCRLPELNPLTTKVLLLSWFHPEIDCGTVCNLCGLEYPKLKYPPLGNWRVLPGKVPNQGPPPWYDLPRIFDVCPACGASTYDVTWPYQTEGEDLAWKKLDGWMGYRKGER
jgi:hypothetical protein